MATRTELLDAFEAKLEAEGSFPAPLPESAVAEPDGRSWIHKTYQSRDGVHAVEWQKLLYWDAPAQNVTTAQFYVTDKGTENESAEWFKGQNPKPDAPDPTISQQFETWLQSKIDDGTIRHYSGVSANAATETGTCTVVINVGGTPTERRVIVEKTAEGVQYEVME